MGDAKTVKTICESFNKRSADTKSNLIKAYANNNIPDLRRHAHSLKGASGYICSDLLKNSALKLQLACDAVNNGETTDLSEVEDLLQQLYEQLALVMAAVDEHLKSLAKPP